MIITVPSPISPVPPSSTWSVDVAIDLAAHVVNVIVRAPGAPPKIDTQPLPANLQTALETYAQGRAESLLGVAPGSSTIQTP